MAKLIGNAPNQVPTNADLGSMAFEDRTNYITKNNPVHQPFRNIIINGDMSIAQRGTSATGISSGNTYHTVDRFATELGGLGTWTQTQSTDVPTGQGFAKSLKMDCTTADATPSVSDYAIIKQLVEGQNLQYLKKGTSNAESVTMSFWVKSNKTGTYIVELADRDNTRKISQAYTINTSDTWEKKILVYSGDASGAFNNDNGNSLDCYFWLGAGTTFTSGTLNTSWSNPSASNRAVGQVNLADSTANEFYITGVQLEAGTSASDFEFLPFDVNLERCLRYYQKSFEYDVTPVAGVSKSEYQHIGNYTTNEFAGLMSLYKKEMRTTPTVTLYTTSASSNGTGRITFYNGSSWSNATASIHSGSTSKNFSVTGSSFPNIVLAQYNYEAEAEL